MTSQSSSRHSDEDNHVQKHRRGAFIMTKIDRLTRNGRKIQVNWNTKGQPFGEYASLFQHFIGYHTRARVPISISKWKAVSEDVKSLICHAVMEKFDVDESKIRFIIRSAAKKWSDFKHIITTEYLYTSKDKSQMRTDPPVEYPFIDKDTWAEFVRQRCTSEFQEVSERNSEFAKQNKYPYKRSRKSYARIEEEMLKEQGLDPTTSSVPRCDLWMAGRETLNGGHDEQVMEVVRTIGSLKERVSEGEISQNGREDILCLALGSKDPPGRIRGLGAGVGVKYLGDKRCKYSSGVSDSRINELQEKVELLEQKNLERDKEMKKLRIQLEFFQKGWKEIQGHDPPIHMTFSSSVHGSCSMTKTPCIEKPANAIGNESCSMPKEAIEHCDLFWPDLSVKVARGRAFMPTPGTIAILHCLPLGEDRIKVQVDVPLMPDVVVPFPTEEVNSVLDATGTLVAWPKSMVIFDSDVIKQSKDGASHATPETHMVICPQRHPKYTSAMEKYRTCFPSIGNNFLIKIGMKEDIFHSSQQLHVGKEQLRVWIEKKEIDSTHVAVYMKNLYESYQSNNYALFCPIYLADGYKDSYENKQRYMVDSMCKAELQNHIWFAPYNEGLHWMLAVIKPMDNIIFWLDPLRMDVNKKFKSMLEITLSMFLVQKGKVNRKKTRWVNILCPQQQDIAESGYYICRYMKEIMVHQCSVIPINYFRGSPETYNEELIDELREEWLHYLETQH